MADAPHDFRAHANTYEAFNKLCLFTILWVTLLLCCMALSLVANLALLALLLGLGGTFALLVFFALVR
ncbi:MAG: hypothetical protein FJX02_03585 [Alphaproteobacteria bacterium]|nr:hypothetical protein [Alphaproteobacteria bacterium]